MLTKEEGRKNLSSVIDRFNRWKKERGLNNEDDVKDLIYELFERVLSWDKDDIYKERHPGPTSKRADFQFKINGITKLILETKALGISWDKNIFRQAIGYGWGANKEYVVLTNFQRFILFNAKWKDKDKKIFEIENIEECLTSEQKFDLLWLLSKDSFLKGKIDEFSESIGKKLKKLPISTIDKHLLNDLKKWREMLTKDIKSLNNLSESEVDEVVQKLINRFIFIRVCEDRGLEPNFAELRSHLRIWSEKKAKPLLEQLLFVFKHYDNVYDSTIFQKDDLCEKVKIHNNVLEKIIEQLYVAEDVGIEYNFASIDADVLGSVYEEYLGYLLKGKKITENHFHRKEQGIYYTPTYIVDYIVRNTLGEVLKQSKEIDKIKVLDPACGSGSFLIKAFDVISEFWKEKIGEEKFNRQIKNSILINNIYGVDLDPKAVEIAQLNLFLKIGEKGELPKLKNNIKCGNSLIDDPAVAGDKAFKWEEEFPEIMKDGGFDVIIGNPPYIDYREIDGINFIKKNYYSANVKDKFNILILFIERGLKLLKEGGILGFIVSNQFLCSDFGLKIREYILKNTKIRQIIDVSMVKVFRDASTYPIIIILEKSNPYNNLIK
ncbi:MAG: N-6 DNA methylase, partial [Candidatus Aenigmatarchaeota archaeon]